MEPCIVGREGAVLAPTACGRPIGPPGCSTLGTAGVPWYDGGLLEVWSSLI